MLRDSEPPSTMFWFIGIRLPKAILLTYGQKHWGKVWIVTVIIMIVLSQIWVWHTLEHSGLMLLKLSSFLINKWLQFSQCSLKAILFVYFLILISPADSVIQALKSFIDLTFNVSLFSLSNLYLFIYANNVPIHILRSNISSSF